VRKALSADATHRHLSGLCTAGPIHYTLQEVVDSLRAGDRWTTLADGHKIEIHIVDACPHEGCAHGPYIATNPNGTDQDNLENLDVR
jgi:hypothetical protein